MNLKWLTADYSEKLAAKKRRILENMSGKLPKAKSGRAKSLRPTHNRALKPNDFSCFLIFREE
jgi:hypothetical protein